MKIIVLSSLAFSLTNFRGDLLKELRAAGHEVIAAAPDDDPEVIARLHKMGIAFHRTDMARASTNVLSDLRTIADYVRLFRDVRPDAVIAYTQKPIIYGGLACRICGIDRFYALMSGLGYLFSEAAGNRKLLKLAFCRLYREGLRRARRIFVFNSDDRKDMLEAGIIDRSSPVIQVPGSGVDLSRFAQAPVPEGPSHFLMVGRLMRDKGVWDFAEAAAIVKTSYPDARFTLIGRMEPSNPTGLKASEITDLQKNYPVDLVPGTDDVPSYLRDAHVFVLPTYYREGLPRTILEAIAVGRPVITTDTAGCRDAVIHGDNGYLIQPKNVEQLADAMIRLADDRGQVSKMGANARALAERVYDVRKVNRQLLEEMELAGTTRDQFDGNIRGSTSSPQLKKSYSHSVG